MHTVLQAALVLMTATPVISSRGPLHTSYLQARGSSTRPLGCMEGVGTACVFVFPVLFFVHSGHSVSHCKLT